MAFDHLDNDALLDALDAERGKFTDADHDVMRDLIGELILRGVYPAKLPVGNPNTIEGMVDGWGARWFMWRGPFECPHCRTDLRSPIGPPFKREVGLYDQGRDRTVGFKCPDCGKAL